jgi:hypothetical protein
MIMLSVLIFSMTLLAWIVTVARMVFSDTGAWWPKLRVAQLMLATSVRRHGWLTAQLAFLTAWMLVPVSVLMVVNRCLGRAASVGKVTQKHLRACVAELMQPPPPPDNGLRRRMQTPAF